MATKIHPNDISFSDTSCNLDGNVVLITELQKLFLELSPEEFRTKYNLSARSYDLIIHKLCLHKPRSKSRSKTALFMESISDIDEFEKNYRSLPTSDLIVMYNTTETILKSAAKKLGIVLTKEEILNKVKLTNLKKYGTEWYSSTSAWNDRVKQTRLEKYGDENYNNSEKTKQTCLERYGETNINKCAWAKEKIKQANLKRCGYENYFTSNDFKEKAAKTKLERYGNSKYTNRQKAEETCLKKYGVRNPNQCEAVKNKRANTNLKKYGTTNVFANKEIKEKIKSVMEAKYGVPYGCMTEQCRNAATLENSSANLAFKALLDNNNIEYEREFPLGGYSYDFKVNNFLIEINPTATHNSTWGWRGNKDRGLNKYYHQNKSAVAVENNYQCICVWDWDDPDKVIKLITPRDAVYARECEIKEVSAEIAKDFLTEYHLQGYVPDSIRLGLYYQNKLVSLMTFGKLQHNKNYQYELLRYCSAANIIGGAEKLFAYFIEIYNPNSIISYCDLSKFSGNVYNELGFTKVPNKIKPSKHWVHPYYKKHITDDLLRQHGFDQLFGTSIGENADNNTLMLQAGFVEVYDCGQATYIYNNKAKEALDAQIFMDS